MASKKTKRLSKEPYKGVRDLYPEDQFVERYIFRVARDVVERFGYVEYNTSLLEPTELYEAKTGEEIVSEQTYSFKDRGGRSVTLRPEMTPSVARLVAKRRRELTFPLRWYSVQNMFRYERPQKGRLREHEQLNADLFGVTGIEADVEIIEVASEIMKALGAKESDFEIRVNNRKIMRMVLLDCFGIDKEKERALMRITDKKEKLKKETFEKEVKKILGDKTNEYLKLIRSKNIQEMLDCVSPRFRDTETLDEVTKLSAALEERGITNVRFDPSLVRGFDYYNGMVFEIRDTNRENSRSLFGGGRFDKILEIFGEPDVPAVGFGMGNVRIIEFLKTRGLIPPYRPTTDLFVCTVEKKYLPDAQQLAKTLREKGIRVEVNMTDKKVPDQIKLADRKSVPFILCVGEKEKDNKKYILKTLSSGEEAKLSADEIPEFVAKSKI